MPRNLIAKTVFLMWLILLDYRGIIRAMARCELALGCVSRGIHRRGPNTAFLRSGDRLVGPLVPVRPSPSCRQPAQSSRPRPRQDHRMYTLIYSTILFILFYVALRRATFGSQSPLLPGIAS